MWLFGVVWLFWLRVLLLYVFLVLGAVPRIELSRAMDRNLYYIGIAFFGMVNGLFNQLWMLFAYDPRAKSWRRRCCSAAMPLTSDVRRR